MSPWAYVGYAVGALVAAGLLLAFVGDNMLLKLWYGHAVFADTSAEALTRAKAALREADIPFTLAATKSRSNYLGGRDAQYHAGIGISGDGESGLTVYELYMPRKKHGDAIRAIGR